MNAAMIESLYHHEIRKAEKAFDEACQAAWDKRQKAMARLIEAEGRTDA